MSEIADLLSKLTIADSPKQVLIDIKITLTGYNQVSRIPNVPQLSDYVSIFDKINSSDSEQVELCVEILKKLLPLVNPKIVVEELGEHLNRCIKHPDEAPKLLAFNQIQLCGKEEGGIHVLLTKKPLVLGTIACLGDASLGVVKHATDTIIVICASSEGVNAIFSTEVSDVLEGVMKKSDSCRFNVYEMIIKVALLHGEALAIVSNSGHLDKLISEVTGGDILVQLNALEMLTNFAVNPAGLTLLQRAGVVAKFQYLLAMTETDPLTAMLLPGLLKFFGNVGHTQPLHLAEHFPSVMTSLFKISSGKLDSVDFTTAVVAFETITYIGFNLEGKYALMKFEKEMKESLEYFSLKSRSSTTEQKTRILEAVIPLFVLQPLDQNEDVLNGIMSWWGFFFDTNTLEKLVSLIKQPFPDLHISALILLKTIVILPWGQNLLMNEAGFLEYLLDRGTETSKRGKELKWEVLKTIIETPFSSSIFPSDYIDKISKYVKEGAFYVQADPQLAFEGDGDT